MEDKNMGGGCTAGRVAWWLIIIGGLVHGLRGLGIFFNIELDPVMLLLGSWPMLPAVIYVVVGIATVYKLVGCPCGKCMFGRGDSQCDHCAKCTTDGCSGHEGKDGGAMKCDHCMACTPNCTMHEMK
ncbi:MAG TPA: DUF378 domain-containing protein [Candidatus Paceibacterota bacterium]|nr:DUF378 domain-containing protein [Candidatus Paceibacterota bacterium]